jgi:hypothetical protein
MMGSTLVRVKIFDRGTFSGGGQGEIEGSGFFVRIPWAGYKIKIGKPEAPASPKLLRQYVGMRYASSVSGTRQHLMITRAWLFI